MSASRKSRAPTHLTDISPEQRREEIVALFATGLERLIERGRPASEELSESGRQIFELYLEHEALVPVVRVLNDRGWNTKRWTTRKGKARGGRPFDKNGLYNLLTNVVYLGKVRYKDEVHEGEHDAIVSTESWQRVQQVLARNGRTGGAAVRNKYGAILKGILHCAPCGCSMGHTYSSKNGTLRYRYYVCLNAQKRGWDSCPSKSVPAEEIERLVVEQIRAIGRDPSLVAATISHARKQAQEKIDRLKQEKSDADARTEAMPCRGAEAGDGRDNRQRTHGIPARRSQRAHPAG